MSGVDRSRIVLALDGVGGRVRLDLTEEVHRARAQELIADEEVDVEAAAQQAVARRTCRRPRAG